jgi:hypothetical protein
MEIKNYVHKFLQSGRSWYQRDVSKITVITVHHDAIPHGNKTDIDLLNQIYNTHKGKDWPGASYHYWISQGGTIYQLNNHTDVTWHDSNNWDSIGVCVNGYFHPDHNNEPTKAQLESLKWLLTELSTKHPEFPAGFGNIVGHRERWATACPGNNFFPLVVEFREKRGNVSWTEGGTKLMEITKSDFDRLMKFSLDRDSISEYFGMDKEQDMADGIKRVVAGYKARITELENKLANILDTEHVGADNVSRKLSWYVTEAVNRGEQVISLKQALTRSESDKKDLSSRIKELEKNTGTDLSYWQGRVTALETSLRECGVSRGMLVEQITTLQTELVGAGQRIAALETKIKDQHYGSANDLTWIELLSLSLRKLIGLTEKGK